MADDAPKAPKIHTPPGMKPPKVRQAHGGALYRGGVPGNKGGRPPSALRQLCRANFETLAPRLLTIARSKKATNADIVRVAELFGRLGMDRSLNVDDVRHALDETARAIREKYPPDLAAEILVLIEPFWMGL